VLKTSSLLFLWREIGVIGLNGRQVFPARILAASTKSSTARRLSHQSYGWLSGTEPLIDDRALARVVEKRPGDVNLLKSLKTFRQVGEEMSV